MARSIPFENANKTHMKDVFLGTKLNTVKEESEADIIEADKNGLFKEEEQTYIKKWFWNIQTEDKEALWEKDMLTKYKICPEFIKAAHKTIQFLIHNLEMY